VRASSLGCLDTFVGTGGGRLVNCIVFEHSDVQREVLGVQKGARSAEGMALVRDSSSWAEVAWP